MAAAAKLQVAKLTETLRKGWGSYTECGTTKVDQIKFSWQDRVPHKSPYRNTLRYDLAMSYYWSGNFLFDFVFFVCQWHPILGIFLCHPNHPWSKMKRLSMYIISLELTMVPTMALTVREEDDNWEWIFSFVTVPNLILGLVLYQLSIARIRCPNTCGKFFKYCSLCCRVSMLVVGLLLSLGCFYVVAHTEKGQPWFDMIFPLLLGQLYYQFTWFPLWILMPCKLGFISLWCQERRAAQQAKAAGEDPDAARIPSREPDESLMMADDADAAMLGENGDGVDGREYHKLPASESA